MRFPKVALSGSAFLVGGLLLAACSSSPATPAASGIPKGPITMGALFTLSGPSAAFGDNEQQIENILLKRLNAQGGIDGHTVKLIALNDQGDVTDAVNAANELVGDHVAAVLYPGTTATDAETTPVFMKAKIPTIFYTPDDTWSNGTMWPYEFNTNALNGPAIAAEARYMKSKGDDKVAVLADNTPFGTSVGADFASAAQAAGIQIVAQQTYPATAVDVTTELGQLKASGVNNLVLLAQVGIQTVYAGLQSLGWTPNLWGTGAAYFEGYSSLGPLAAHSWANCEVAVQSGQNLDPQLASLVNTVVAQTGPQPDYALTVLNINDDLLILKYAIEKANSLNGPAIASAIETISNKSFTDPGYKYTFTKTAHAGLESSDIRTCILSPTGEYGTPVLAQ